MPENAIRTDRAYHTGSARHRRDTGNRDPARFPDPERLDRSRAERDHLAFGHGVHYCLGAPLARLETESAFITLLAGCPDLALAVEPSALVWRHSRALRALERLPVTFTPSA